MGALAKNGGEAPRQKRVYYIRALFYHTARFATASGWRRSWIVLESWAVEKKFEIERERRKEKEEKVGVRRRKEDPPPSPSPFNPRPPHPFFSLPFFAKQPTEATEKSKGYICGEVADVPLCHSWSLVLLVPSVQDGLLTQTKLHFLVGGGNDEIYK